MGGPGLHCGQDFPRQTNLPLPPQPVSQPRAVFWGTEAVLGPRCPQASGKPTGVKRSRVAIGGQAPALWPQFPFLTLIWVRASPLSLDVVLVRLRKTCVGDGKRKHSHPAGCLPQGWDGCLWGAESGLPTALPREKGTGQCGPPLHPLPGRLSLAGYPLPFGEPTWALGWKDAQADGWGGLERGPQEVLAGSSRGLRVERRTQSCGGGVSADGPKPRRNEAMPPSCPEWPDPVDRTGGASLTGGAVPVLGRGAPAPVLPRPPRRI